MIDKSKIWAGICSTGLFMLALVTALTCMHAHAASGKDGQFLNELADGWRLVQTPNPLGGPEAVSIMHTADPSRSDLDFVGLMIRCDRGMPQLAIVLLRAFPIRARPRVTLGERDDAREVEATIGPPGTTVILPGDPKTLFGRSWSAEGDFFMRVVDGPATISGVVALAGVQSALPALIASCPRS